LSQKNGRLVAIPNEHLGVLNKNLQFQISRTRNVYGTTILLMDPFSFHSCLDSRQVFSTFGFEIFNSFWGSKKERNNYGIKKEEIRGGLGFDGGNVELGRAFGALGGNACGITLEFGDEGMVFGWVDK
jgi:hypothetical protein